MSHRDNSFDFARLLGAFMVLYSHSFAIAGLPEPAVGSMWSFGSLGVFIFFSISGYLITMSWQSDPNLFRFLFRRSLRIFPGLIVMVLLTVFAFGPAVSTLPVRAYFGHPATYRYLRTMALHIHYYLPGCFEQAPLHGVINGSLWSLPPEVLMYAILAALGVATLLMRRWLTFLFTCALCLADMYLLRNQPFIVPILRWVIPPHPQPIGFLSMEVHEVLFVAPYFWAGVVIRLFQERIRFSMAYAIAAFALLTFLPAGPLTTVWSFVAVPYIVLAFCTQSERLFHIPTRVGDLSYGLYIYAFPAGQWVRSLSPRTHSVYVVIVGSAAVTVVCAFLSWRLIESPMLRLKPRRRKAEAAAAGSQAVHYAAPGIFTRWRRRPGVPLS